MNIEKRKILTKDFRKNDDSCDVSVSFIASSSNEKFGQMDEVLQQLSPKQASLAEDFGQNLNGDFQKVVVISKKKIMIVL